MRRTYFVPICVTAGFFVVAGIVSVVLSVMLSQSLNTLDTMFVSHYKPPGVYHLLYHEAHDLRLRLSRQQRETGEIAIAFNLLMGVILLWWAFDRRKIVRKLNALSAHETDVPA